MTHLNNKVMQDIHQKVENLGVVIERFGKTPIASRVFAYLLIAEPPQKSFDEIVEFLGASKSSVSNALNTLQLEKIVKYVTYSGDRKRYFLIDTKNWLELNMNLAKNLESLNELLKEVVLSRKESNALEFNQGIENILKFQLFITDRIGKNIEEWKNK